MGSSVSIPRLLEKRVAGFVDDYCYTEGVLLGSTVVSWIILCMSSLEEDESRSAIMGTSWEVGTYIERW